MKDKVPAEREEIHRDSNGNSTEKSPPGPLWLFIIFPSLKCLEKPKSMSFSTPSPCPAVWHPSTVDIRYHWTLGPSELQGQLSGCVSKMVKFEQSLCLQMPDSPGPANMKLSLDVSLSALLRLECACCSNRSRMEYCHVLSCLKLGML